MAEDASAALLTPEIFGPEDAIALDAHGDPAPGGHGGGYVPTDQGSDLNGSTINIQKDGSQVLNNLGLIGALAKLVIDLLIALGTWIAGELQGVPQQAKTIGTGTQLAHAHDPISQWIGLQLAGGGAAGRILSEGNWPLNFGGHILAMGGALITFANREPPSSYWKVRDTPASAITRFNDDPRQFRVGPVPPPKGAPYGRPVIIDGFFAQQILDADAYKAKWGFDQPTADQLVLFFDDQRGIMWNDHRVPTGRLFAMRDAFLQLWIDAYKLWIKENPQPTPGGPPPPPSGVCNDPCEIQVIEQLYSIALQINQNVAPTAAIAATLPLIQKAIENLTGGGSSDAIVLQLEAIAQGIKAADAPLMAILENLPLFIQALQNLSDPAVASVLQKLVDCVCPNLDKIAASLEKGGGGGGPDYSAILNRIADGLAPDSPANQAALQRYRSMVQLLRDKYGLPGDLGQILLSA